MRIFLDANILFSAAKSDGAVRRMLADLHAEGHTLVADAYVAVEAQRNIAAKASAVGGDYLRALLSRIEVNGLQHPAAAGSAVQWLPEKDRPVLLAAIGCQCDVLVTGDRKHFGPGYGKSFDGVRIYSPAQLAISIWDLET
jgi:predicted nucleic acid-binding protein